MIRPPVAVVTPDLLRAWPVPTPEGKADKDSRGRVLVVAGGAACPGAARLAGEAALRSGAGKLQFATAAGVAPHLGLACPEALVLALPQDADGEIDGQAPERLLALARRADAILIGPGMMDDGAATALTARLLAEAPDAAFLLDAGALARLGEHGDLLRARRVAITPHCGEMATLLDAARDAVEIAPELTAHHAAVVLGVRVALKEATTWIADPDGRVWKHEAGPQGLGTAGSGDVLAGLAAGLLARGCDPARALVHAVWVHAEAARRVEARSGPFGYLARALSPEFPAILGEMAG